MWTFFGLDEQYKELIYEVRRWFLERLVKQKEEENKAAESADRSSRGHTHDFK